MNERSLRVARSFLKTEDAPKEISVKFINPEDQKYDTDGDYYEKKNKWEAYISKMTDWRFAYACMLHELIEMGLTKARGVNWDAITEYDKDHPEEVEPGLDKEAPYHKEHMDATNIERQMIKLFGLKWDDYQKSFDQASAQRNKKSYRCNEPPTTTTRENCSGKKKYKEFHKKLKDGTTIYSVDGDYVRNNLEVDFIGGGHGYVYTFIPKNEIWIEQRFSQDDQTFFLMHEMIERLLMIHAKWTYNKAHAFANDVERVLRGAPK